MSADTVEQASGFKDRLGLGFPVFSDHDRAVIGAWGVADPEKPIAKPATFVVRTGGEIVFSHVGSDAADRPSVTRILEVIDGL